MSIKTTSSYRNILISAVAAGFGLVAMAPIATADSAPVWNIGGDNPTVIDEALDTIFCGNDFSADGCKLALLIERPKSSASPAAMSPAPQSNPGSAPEVMELLDEDAGEDEDDEGC
jgi:hypothetical protein